MANFYGYDFIYDDTPSQTYDLQILSFEDGGLFSGVGSSDVEIYSQKVMRKAKSYYLGRSQSTPLEFSLTFGTAYPVSGMERDIISAWLFGRSEYKKLYILQDDLNGAYFNCFMKEPEILYIGGVNYAFRCKIVCDSPFAYSPEKIVTQSFAGDNFEIYDVDVYNYSSDDDYLYPTVDFNLNTIGDSFIITNETDTDREFEFTGLQANEVIEVDNDLQIITSDTGLKRLDTFNKNWFRLLPGKNVLNIQSGMDSFSITYTEKIKIGG